MCKLNCLKQYFLNHKHAVFLLIFVVAILYFFPKIITDKAMWGAFFGAGFAFVLNYVHELDHIKRKNCQTLIKEHVKLQLSHRQLSQIKDYMEDRKKEALKTKLKYGISEKDWGFLEWQFIGPYLHTHYHSPFSEGNLDFMLETKAFKCLKAILLANDQYKQVVFLLQERNKLYENYLAKIEGLDESERLSFEILVKRIGEKSLGQNCKYYEALSGQLNNSIEDIKHAFTQTGQFIKTTWNREPLTSS